MDDDGRDGDADGGVARHVGEVVDDLVDDRGHGVGGGRLGRQDLEPLAGEVTRLEVDGGALDAAAADVDAEGFAVLGHGPCFLVEDVVECQVLLVAT